jgi:CubicO group peptidase (beta-lactamase class C family)
MLGLSYTPAFAAVDQAALKAAMDYGQQKGAGSIRVVRSGVVLGTSGDQAKIYQLKSATKGIGGMLLSIAISEERVQLGNLVINRFPDFARNPTDSATRARRRKATIEQLAVHLAGFAGGDPGEVAIIRDPGTGFLYSNAGYNWLADTLTHVYHQDLAALFKNRTGIIVTWRRNQYRRQTLDGVPRREFASGVSASVTTMAKIGQLALTGGRGVNNSYFRTPRSILSGKAVISTDTPGATKHYGLGWWNNADGSISGVPKDAYWAWGLGDTVILAIPSLKLVVTRGGAAWQSGGWSARYSVVGPFFQKIVAAVS